MANFGLSVRKMAYLSRWPAFRRGAQSEVSYQPVQVVRVQPQGLRSFCDISAGLIQTIHDQLFFQIANRVMVSRRRVFRAFCALRNDVWQILRHHAVG